MIMCGFTLSIMYCMEGYTSPKRQCLRYACLGQLVRKCSALSSSSLQVLHVGTTRLSLLLSLCARWFCPDSSCVRDLMPFLDCVTSLPLCFEKNILSVSLLFSAILCLLIFSTVLLYRIFSICRFTWDLLKLIMGSGPKIIVSAPMFATRSALSFPFIPLCAFILMIFTLLIIANLFRISTVSIVCLDEEWELASLVIVDNESEYICTS